MAAGADSALFSSCSSSCGFSEPSVAQTPFTSSRWAGTLASRAACLKVGGRGAPPTGAGARENGQEAEGQPGAGDVETTLLVQPEKGSVRLLSMGRDSCVQRLVPSADAGDAPSQPLRAVG